MAPETESTAVRAEPFDSPFILSQSKDERLAQQSLVEACAWPSTGCLRQAQAERFFPNVLSEVEGQAQNGDNNWTEEYV